MCEAPPPGKRRAGVLCFRPSAAEASPAGAAAGPDGGFELLLVSRQSRKEQDSVKSAAVVVDDRYTIPAGKFEANTDHSCEDCAEREAMEEAGIECRLVHDLGWHSHKSKNDQPIQTRYFLGACVRLLESWQEDGSRERLWCSPEDALQRVSYRTDLSAVIREGIEALRARASGSWEAPSASSVAVPARGPLQAGGGALREEAPVGGGGAEAMRWAESDAASGDNGASEERYVFYSHQVGGHFCMVKPLPGTRLEVELPLRSHGRSGDNCIVHGGKVILKPFDADEERFYCQLPDGTLAPLLPFTPLFYGTKKLRREQLETLANGKEVLAGIRQPERIPSDPGDVRESQYALQHVRRYLVLEDLGSEASRPSFLDLKVGCRQRAARHNAQKRAHMARKAAQSTSAALGFRICGMQCYDRKSGDVQRYDKYWGQQVTVDSMTQTLAMFFADGHEGPLTGICGDLVGEVIRKLQLLEATLRQLPGMRFWGSSLLVFFDAALTDEGHTEAFLRSVQLKMIDFANFEKVGGDVIDEEYLCGVKNLQVFLRGLLEAGAVDSSYASKLSAPPCPAVQDEEQQHAWEALQLGARGEPHSGKAATEDDTGGHLAANAQTISGATGRTLLRELASHQFVRADNGGTTPSAGLGCIAESDHDGHSNLDDLFA